MDFAYFCGMLKRILLVPAVLTAVSAGATEPLRFAFVTDCHYSSGSGAGRDLSLCIRDINSLDGIDFVLFGGDMTDFGTDEEIFAVKSIMDSLRVQYYVVAGNHDAKWSESGCNTFRRAFGYEHFEFRSKGWRLLGCNSGPDMRMAPALLPRESMDWLRSIEDDGTPGIFINHYPLDTSVLNYFDVTKALKRAGVQFCIGGHWHRNCAMDYDGLPAVLGRSSLKGRTGQAGYNIVTLDGSRVSISERLVFPHSSVQLPPWYEKELAPVRDTVEYDSSGLPPSYPWTRYDVNRQYPEVKELWHIEEDSNIASGFARSGRKAWYATTSGCIRCIDTASGRRLWSRSFGAKIFSTPSVSGGTLVFGCADGSINALEARSGRTLWSVKAGKSVLGSPVISGGRVFIGSSDGKFRAISLEGGDVLWSFDGVEGFVECRPYVDESQLVFGSWGGWLYSLDPSSGRLQWKWKTPRTSRMYSPAATWPVKAEGRIFIAVPDRKVYALDASNGKELFHADGGRESIGLSSDRRTVLAKTMYNSSYAFDAAVPVPEGGELPREALKWSIANGAHYEIGPSAITEIDGMVITPTDKGNLFALSLEDGGLLWWHKVSPALVNPVECWMEKDGVRILVSTMDGVVALLKVER